jgi:ribulose-phosphate 3-epimerase
MREVSDTPAGVRLSPSLACADLLDLSAALRAMIAADVGMVHVDATDSTFTTAMGLTPELVAATHRAFPRLFIDVHLMVATAARDVAVFCEAGASRVLIHVEALDFNVAAEIARSYDVEVGAAIRPETCFDRAREVLPGLSSLLLFTVAPGVRGQTILPEAVARVRDGFALTSSVDGCELQVDGGVYVDSIGKLVRAGARTLVVGSAFFGSDGKGDCVEAANRLRAAAKWAG